MDGSNLKALDSVKSTDTNGFIWRKRLSVLANLKSRLGAKGRSLDMPPDLKQGIPSGADDADELVGVRLNLRVKPADYESRLIVKGIAVKMLDL